MSTSGQLAGQPYSGDKTNYRFYRRWEAGWAFMMSHQQWWQHTAVIGVLVVNVDMTSVGCPTVDQQYNVTGTSALRLTSTFGWCTTASYSGDNFPKHVRGLNALAARSLEENITILDDNYLLGNHW